VCNDHEEIGSRSEAGAQGTMLNDLVSRLVETEAERQQVLRHSMMFSVDNAHGIHPNYPDRHDEHHGPQLNKGPVIKFDADQGYATSSVTAAFVRWLATQGDELPLQTFVTRADMRCGSTIGPITASNLGIKTVDLGNAQFAMHSCRELTGAMDTIHMHSLLSRFYRATDLPV
jgi:aspartyl aminopeptidase